MLTPPCQGPCHGSTVFKLLRCQWLPLGIFIIITTPLYIILISNRACTATVFQIHQDHNHQHNYNSIIVGLIIILNIITSFTMIVATFTWSGMLPCQYTNPGPQHSRI